MNVFNNIVVTKAHKHPINGVYGFINQFCENVNDVKPDYVYVCTDTRPYIRSTLFPDYKKSRKERGEDELIISRYNRRLCYDFVETLGLNIWGEVGYEADDLIAILCEHYAKKFAKIVVASSDSDLVQLLETPNVIIRKRVKGKTVHYSQKSFNTEFSGFDYVDYIRYYAIMGTHNSIPGIYGLGKQKAGKVVLDKVRYANLYKKHREELDLYIKLIKLPISHELTVPSLVRAKYDERMMLSFMIKRDIDLTQNMRRAFEYIGG